MKQDKIYKVVLVVLHFFIGIGAIAGGFGGVTNPQGLMGLTTEALKTGPFDSFFIPGLFLMVVIGFGNIIAGVIVIKKLDIWPYATGFMAVVLVSWIVIQCVVMQAVAGLHVIFFILGTVQGLIALHVFLRDIVKLKYLNANRIDI